MQDPAYNPITPAQGRGIVYRSLLAWIVLIAAYLCLSGCAGNGMWRAAAAQRAAAESDATMETALWYICNGASNGSVQREFSTPIKREAHDVLCDRTTFTALLPSNAAQLAGRLSPELLLQLPGNPLTSTTLGTRLTPQQLEQINRIIVGPQQPAP